MFDVFGSVKGFLKLDQISIDNTIFRLHYKLTVIALVTFSLIVTSRQYIGDPIDCIVDEIPLNVMDTYCWIYSTYTIPNRLNGRIGKDVIQPGVGNHVEGEDHVLYHKYYQWVCFVLFFQAMLFYVPRLLWKNWEAGRAKMLVLDMNCPIMSEEFKVERKKILIEYFTLHLYRQNSYAYRFFFCEFLNFVNVFFQIYFVDYFLEGEFSSYGLEVFSFLNMEPEQRSDPMARVFPKVTKCTFRKFGPSGSIQKFDGLCVLPLNIVNEKIYCFIWVWFWILGIVSACSIGWRIATIMFPAVRCRVLRNRAYLADSALIKNISQKLQIGDWFVLTQLGKNIDPLIFKEVVAELASTLEGKQDV